MWYGLTTRARAVKILRGLADGQERTARDILATMPEENIDRIRYTLTDLAWGSREALVVLRIGGRPGQTWYRISDAGLVMLQQFPEDERREAAVSPR